MKNLLKKLKSINKGIEEIETSIRLTGCSNYYIIFGNELERQRDLTDQKQNLKDALALKLATLDSLQIAINAEKADISYTSRNLNLKSA